jgi:glycosyltransferase involved in cell wall biosynthesis
VTPSDPWIVSQVGSREHYAIPRGLARRGLLERVVTDYWCPRWLSSNAANSLRWKPLARLRGRFSPEIDRRVVSFNGRAALARALSYGRRPAEGVYAADIEYGRWFAQNTARIIERSPAARVFFGYSMGSLEALQAARRRGLFTVVDQIDPALEEAEIVRQERERFPDWEERAARQPEPYWRRLRDEWSTAHLVVVNSEWSRQSLIKHGLPPEKVAVVPLAYEPPAQASTGHRPAGKNLRVLWLGTVILRKGIQYLLEAARRLPAVEFTVAGPVRISQRVVGAAPSNVRFLGQVPHLQTAELFKTSDLFLFPTLSDGFGLTQLEAMAWGLPVVTTRHCGEVVIDAENGLLVPARDGQAIAEAIARVEADRELLAALSRKALATVTAFSLENITTRLLREVGQRS